MGPVSQMVYDENIFVAPIPNDHLCPVCQGVMQNVAQTVCGHRFCLDCIKRALAMQANCPLCRTAPRHQETSGSPVSPTGALHFFRDRAHERIILDKEVECPTCHLVITFKELLTDHDSRCPEAAVSCSFHGRGCAVSVTRRALAEHEASCEHRDQSCPKCSARMPKNRLMGHLLFKCRRNLVICQACDRAVQFCRFGEHRNRCSWAKTQRRIVQRL